MMEDFPRLMAAALAWLKGGWLGSIEYALRGITRELQPSPSTVEQIELSQGSSVWHIGDPIDLTREAKVFLEALATSGNRTFIHDRMSCCGGAAGGRSVEIIYQGHGRYSGRGFYQVRGRRWEVLFVEDKRLAVATTTLDLPSITSVALAWLSGGWLVAVEDTLRGAVRT
jgi:hypothetical protein